MNERLIPDGHTLAEWQAYTERYHGPGSAVTPITGLPKPRRSAVLLDEVLRTACEGVAGITPAQFRLLLGVGEGDEVTWVSVAVFEEKAQALAGLKKGAEVYIKGRLTMNTWEGKDGQQRTGLSVSAWRVKVLGRIGESRKHAEEFDDALTF